MTEVLLPDSRDRRLTFFLAMEEYLARDVREDLVFLWQTGPTVIFGRNQDMAAEVNVPFCEERGIALVRRKSGGGCVYSDRGNLMVSCITPDTNAAAVFARFLGLLAGALSDLGLPAVVTEHNDILVDGRKVSGNAFYGLPQGSIVHGTMLYDLDVETMERALTPSGEKLARHAVASVRARVRNLRAFAEGVPQLASCAALRDWLASRLADGSRVLTEAELRTIESIEKQYTDPVFLYGKRKFNTPTDLPA